MKQKIYILPGLMCNEKLWSAIYETLDGELELIHTPIPRGDSLDEITDALLNRFPEEKINLAGFSLGGYLASYITARHPDRVKKLLVISNSPCELRASDIKQRLETLRWLDTNTYKGISREKALSFTGQENHNEHVIDTIIEMDAELGETVFKEQLRCTTERMDLADALLKLTLPVTLVYSKDDPLVNKDWMGKLIRANPLFIAVPIQGSGHMLPLEKPAVLARQLEAWSRQ